MIGLEKLYQNGFYTQKIVRICGKRKSVWHQYWRISYLIYKSFINLFIYMYSQKRFYVSSIVLINHEMLMLHNENCILTLSVVIYILLVTSKNMLMKMCSAIESFYIYISFVKKKKKIRLEIPSLLIKRYTLYMQYYNQEPSDKIFNLFAIVCRIVQFSSLLFN